MGSFHYLADGHHVDDAGNLIACTYVDFRGSAERTPITTLLKVASRRHALPGCGTMRISKPSCFLERGEGLVMRGGERGDGYGRTSASADMDDASTDDAEAAGETYHGRNGWIWCASIEPKTPAEQAAWREAMPPAYDAISPIRRPRAFARALGAMVAEQVGPQGPRVLLRSAVGDRVLRTAHGSQMVYHGPVVYADNPYRRLESASSALEVALLHVFMKRPAHRGQREYRFAVWAHGESGPDRVDLEVSPALLDAMQRRLREPERGIGAPVHVEEPSAVEEVDHPGSSRVGALVEAPLAIRHPTIAPPRYGAEGLPAELREWAGYRRRAPSRPRCRGTTHRPGTAAASSARSCRAAVRSPTRSSS